MRDLKCKIASPTKLSCCPVLYGIGILQGVLSCIDTTEAIVSDWCWYNCGCLPACCIVDTTQNPLNGGFGKFVG